MTFTVQTMVWLKMAKSMSSQYSNTMSEAETIKFLRLKIPVQFKMLETVKYSFISVILIDR
jgi:hypothetical protein